ISNYEKFFGALCSNGGECSLRMMGPIEHNIGDGWCVHAALHSFPDFARLLMGRHLPLWSAAKLLKFGSRFSMAPMSCPPYFSAHRPDFYKSRIEATILRREAIIHPWTSSLSETQQSSAPLHKHPRRMRVSATHRMANARLRYQKAGISLRQMRSPSL